MVLAFYYLLYQFTRYITKLARMITVRSVAAFRLPGPHDDSGGLVSLCSDVLYVKGFNVYGYYTCL